MAKPHRGDKNSGVTGGLKESSILSTRSLVSEREGKQALVDETLGVFNDVYSEYGAQVTDIQLAKLNNRARAIAYYDSEGNIAINEKYFDKKTLDAAYKACVESGFHPSNGNKSALEAVVAHELGHKLTADVAMKMGMQGQGSLHSAASRVIVETKKKYGYSSMSSVAANISKYATYNHAETIAEAFSDVYCNGKNARAESRNIMSVVDGYLKGAN